ncbi:MAG: hypothetical protein KDA98_07515 [Acidimicrobiales bacterium]|nr:hypothetical protein [Acidimicrobiales bacterium]
MNLSAATEPGAEGAVASAPTDGGARWRAWAATAVPLVAWAALVAVAWTRAEPYRSRWKLGAAPVMGSFDRHLTPATVLVLVVGLALARYLPGWCRTLGWRRMLVVATLAFVGWGAATSAIRGVDQLDRTMADRHEYPAVIPLVDEVGVATFVDTFTDEEVLRRYPIHVQGHPVGIALAYVGLDRVGLDGSGWAAAATVAVGMLVVPGVLVTTREVAGEDRARRLAPFLALAPAAVWSVTSADLVFAAVAAWAIALAVLATGDDRDRSSRLGLGVASGLLWGLGIHLTYGLAPIALVALAVIAWRRRWEVLPAIAVGALVVVGAFVAIGFWWFDGLAATRIRYEAGIASIRPRRYFTVLGNPAAFSLAVGPAAWVAVARVRDARLWLLAAGGLAAVAIADLSGLSKAEVERIWLPFAPWVLVLTGGLAALGAGVRTTTGVGRRWSWSPGWPPVAGNLLALQVVLAVAIVSVVNTPW